METHKVESVCQYVDVVIDVTARWLPDEPMPTLWYRGVKDEAYDLLPGAYFRKKCDELTLALYFKQLTPGLLNHEPSDDWEWYYAMQPYGIPTRLLDWSESALAALYFALEEEAPSNPAVWVLHPLALNWYSKWRFLVVPKMGNELDYWLPDNCGRHTSVHTFDAGGRFADNSRPLAIYPKRHNPRIVAQRGVFTVHGMDETPLNKLSIVDENGVERLAKITVEGSKRSTLRTELAMLGLDKTSIYPEPQSVAYDLKQAVGIK
jgi:hypothetical protein